MQVLEQQPVCSRKMESSAPSAEKWCAKLTVLGDCLRWTGTRYVDVKNQEAEVMDAGRSQNIEGSFSSQVNLFSVCVQVLLFLQNKEADERWISEWDRRTT